MTTKQEHASEALQRAEDGRSLTNYPAIYAGMMEKGIQESEIQPRVNVFTYRAWQAKGRQVRKGEHGVKVLTWIPGKATEADPSPRAYPRNSTVFHITQTDEVTP